MAIPQLESNIRQLEQFIKTPGGGHGAGNAIRRGIPQRELAEKKNLLEDLKQALKDIEEVFDKGGLGLVRIRVAKYDWAEIWRTVDGYGLAAAKDAVSLLSSNYGGMQETVSPLDFIAPSKLGGRLGIAVLFRGGASTALRTTIREAAELAPRVFVRETFVAFVGQVRASVAKLLARRGAITRELADEFFCFTPDTLVLTGKGYKLLGELNPGELVYAFDFDTGQWVLSDILQRHDNVYSGTMVTVQLGDTRIEVTANHPFWVVRGNGLPHRRRSEHLPAGEDEGKYLPGRWVDSQELRVGDVVVCYDEVQREIDGVEYRNVKSTRVSNLTIRGHHTFAVGNAAVLVHNQAWCRVLEKVISKPQAL